MLLLSYKIDTNKIKRLRYPRQMSEARLSNNEIGKQIKLRLDGLDWSLRECVERYNRERSIDKDLQKAPPLNKDFLLRIKNSNFKIANQRVSKLCDFLGINLDVGDHKSKSSFQDEFERVESLVSRNPMLKLKVSLILNSILDLAEDTNGKRI